jgi:hypothetical protein
LENRVKELEAKLEETRPFKRENRYFVLKWTDIDAARLPSDLRVALHRAGHLVAAQRLERGKLPLECVVVEKDWPEYEPTWAAIEQRCKAGPGDE